MRTNILLVIIMGSTKNTLMIQAKPYKGGYRLIATNGDKPSENYVYSSRAEAYKACAQMYPSNSSWRGKKVTGGFRINL